ncbi:hypothetical protein KIF53_01420 [Chromobacterium subtsugae]|uniref:DGQHR domain-containing protein n=1 Tax=Chromobacterium subtsugae TaxID=251747 RepID=A0ABS7F881_9NEIS|nr:MULTISPECIES: hypothetical protein [Chromobacterium]MBW7565176.1 hypothetical protein [Chromobacterium subtsugae]MBW8286296.1 hypothetical protein [Chromobacterium subtsugae]WSE91656.1 hypothetical protein U6115_00025 [Chromobacterium subtsugae]WVH60031.1 hypothetical protein U6151_00025 [Chromobacterium subtsugae]
MKMTKFQTIEKMTTVIRGGFGRFKTEKSYPVNYIMASLPIDQLDALTTASELFNVNTIKFDELIQRDIDSSRVRAIANDYLMQSEKKIVFFPPLLACIVIVDETNKIKKQYEEHSELINDDDINNKSFISTWDKNAFELSFGITDDPDESDRVYSSKNYGEIRYFDFAAQLRLNPKKVKLVVLDGQHRLAALNLIHKGANSHILKDVEVPLCIMFSPSADKSISQQDMVDDFRELFVRVNLEQKKVSGHFIILLQDDSYSAMAVREFADELKKIDDTGFSALHLLEWNQRIDELTRKRTRNTALTTIGIIFDVLKDHFFEAGVAGSILQLSTISMDYNGENYDLSQIEDKAIGIDIIDNRVKESITNILTPSLNILLRNPSPYSRVETTVRAAFEKLNKLEMEHNAGFASLKKDYLSKYIYSEKEILEDRCRVCLDEFQSWVNISPSDHVYLLHAFQQGLVRSWINLNQLLGRYEFSPTAIATALISAFEILIFSIDKNYLSPTRSYTKRMLWKNERVNFSSAWSKDAWCHILLISFLHEITKTTFLDHLEKEYSDSFDRKSVDEVLHKYADTKLQDYLGKLSDELIKDTKQNLSELVSTEVYIGLQSKQLSNDINDRKAVETKIRDLTEERMKQVVAELANVLQVEKNTIQY